MLPEITSNPRFRSLRWRKGRGSVARRPWSVNDGVRPPLHPLRGGARLPGMKVIIQGKHLRLSQGLKSYAREHVIGPLNRFYDNEAAELRVELGDVNGRKGGAGKECHLTPHNPGA